MAKTSRNLSERLFFTENYFDNTGEFGELELTPDPLGPYKLQQKILLTLTAEETDQLRKYFRG